MDSRKMGRFIAEMRKAKQMTQKDLAVQLNITDKAVSKWERGLSCPDISILSSVAEILGVTVSELLNGDKEDGSAEHLEKSVNNALQYADTTVKVRVTSFRNLGAAVFTIALLAGIVVCAICDFAVFSGFTWSLYPISSILFAWPILFPLLKFGKEGLFVTMISLTVLTVPFLYVLNRLTGGQYLILPIGIPMSAISLAYLWLVFAVFKILKSKKMLAGSVCLLAAAPLDLMISYTLSKIISAPVINLWDILSISVFVFTSGMLFAFYSKRKDTHDNGKNRDAAGEDGSEEA